MHSVLFTDKHKTNSQPKEGCDPNDRSKLNTTNFCATPKELIYNFVVTTLDIVSQFPILHYKHDIYLQLFLTTQCY